MPKSVRCPYAALSTLPHLGNNATLVQRAVPHCCTVIRWYPIEFGQATPSAKLDSGRE